MRATTLVLLALVAGAAADCTVGTIDCFVDTEARILGDTPTKNPGGGMTTEYCAQICLDAGVALAGVEDGGIG